MPEEAIKQKAIEDLREGKSPSTAAGEFVHEEIEHVREGKHGARSAKQAIAIGLSKARRAGVPLPDPDPKRNSPQTIHKAHQDSEAAHSGEAEHPNHNRSVAREEALEREPHNTVSHAALSRQTKTASHQRTSKERHDAAMKAVHTKGEEGLKTEARKAAKTRKAA